jgi:hypothetical protein
MQEQRWIWVQATAIAEVHADGFGFREFETIIICPLLQVV